MGVMPQAWADVIDERVRHNREEGWTDDHDDGHRNGQLAMAAACYAAPARIYTKHDLLGHKLVRIGPDACLLVDVPIYDDPFPWADEYDKRGKHDRRRRLVIAGALILAEIERLDRAEGGAQ